MYLLNDPIVMDFITYDPDTGEAIDADILPTAEVFENDIDVSMYTPTIVRRENKVGNYRLEMNAIASNGFKVNTSYNVIVTVEVGGVSTKMVVGSFILNSGTFKHIT